MNTRSIITVAIVEDDARIRRSLAAMLGTASDIQCVAECGSGEDALEILPSLCPRVVFMDVHLPGLSGIDCVRYLAELEPKPQIVMLSTHDDSDAIFSSLSAGACGYLLKPIRTNQLVAAVRDVFTGGSPMTGQIARRVVETFSKPSGSVSEPVCDLLSGREREILQFLSEGYLYKEISDKLEISYSSVRTYIERIYEKLHVHSRSQAVAKARKYSTLGGTT
jgi:DNA-binding NarL/FixJ family response regulator